MIILRLCHLNSIIVIILIITTLKVDAQNHLIGIKSGIAWTNVNSDIFKQSGFRHTIPVGITYEYFLKQRFSIEADLLYTQRGFTTDFANPNNEKAELKFNYDYLTLPLKAVFTDFQVKHKLLAFVKIGLVPALLAHAATTMPALDTVGRVTGNETVDITSRVSKFDLAGLVEIGGGYKLEERLWLTTSFQYQHSLTSITAREYFANHNIRHYGLTVQLGLKWALQKE
jgi:hypothetical protein